MGIDRRAWSGVGRLDGMEAIHFCQCSAKRDTGNESADVKGSHPRICVTR
jgi:hypothetical protein